MSNLKKYQSYLWRECQHSVVVSENLSFFDLCSRNANLRIVNPFLERGKLIKHDPESGLSVDMNDREIKVALFFAFCFPVIFTICLLFLHEDSLQCACSVSFYYFLIDHNVFKVLDVYKPYYLDSKWLVLFSSLK